MLTYSKKFVDFDELEVAERVLTLALGRTVDLLIVAGTLFFALEFVVMHLIKIHILLQLALVALVVRERIAHDRRQDVLGLRWLLLFGFAVSFFVEHGFLRFEGAGAAAVEGFYGYGPVMLREDPVLLHLIQCDPDLGILHEYLVEQVTQYLINQLIVDWLAFVYVFVNFEGAFGVERGLA